MHFALGERLLSALVERILALPREDRWQSMARAALRDDLHTVHSCSPRRSSPRPDEQPAPRGSRTGSATRSWSPRWGRRRDRTDDRADLARLSVGLAVVRTMLATP